MSSHIIELEHTKKKNFFFWFAFVRKVHENVNCTHAFGLKSSILIRMAFTVDQVTFHVLHISHNCETKNDAHPEFSVIHRFIFGLSISNFIRYQSHERTKEKTDFPLVRLLFLCILCISFLAFFFFFCMTASWLFHRIKDWSSRLGYGNNGANVIVCVRDTEFVNVVSSSSSSSPSCVMYSTQPSEVLCRRSTYVWYIRMHSHARTRTKHEHLGGLACVWMCVCSCTAHTQT